MPPASSKAYTNQFEALSLDNDEDEDVIMSNASSSNSDSDHMEKASNNRTIRDFLLVGQLFRVCSLVQKSGEKIEEFKV
jgi:hypothetical protein